MSDNDFAPFGPEDVMTPEEIQEKAERTLRRYAQPRASLIFDGREYVHQSELWALQQELAQERERLWRVRDHLCQVVSDGEPYGNRGPKCAYCTKKRYQSRPHDENCIWAQAIAFCDIPWPPSTSSQSTPQSAGSGEGRDYGDEQPKEGMNNER